jgi:hypothetical protein
MITKSFFNGSLITNGFLQGKYPVDSRMQRHWLLESHVVNFVKSETYFGCFGYNSPH